jgi:hypothetical protein
MSNSLNLELPYVQGAQAQKHVTVNDALRRIDSVVQLTVEDRNRSAPPRRTSRGGPPHRCRVSDRRVGWPSV